MTSVGRTWATCIVLLLAAVLGVSAQKTKVVYFHRADFTETEWANDIISLFNKQSPKIEVESLSSGTGGGPDYAEKLTVLRASGNAPDVFYGCADKLGYVLKEWTLDLTPYINRDKAAVSSNTFFPGVFDTFTRDGKTYGIPLTVTPQIVFYNRDLFEKEGLQPLPASWDDRTWTWNALMEYSKKLTHIGSDGVPTQLALTQATESHLPDICWMHGGDWFDEEAYRTGRATRSTMVRNENIQAFEALCELYEQYTVVGPPKGFGTTFTSGGVAMDWIGAWKITSYVEGSRSGTMKFTWGLAPVPLVKNRQNTRWTDPLFISSTTAVPNESWEFVKFATSDEGQNLWIQKTRKIPARRTALGTFVRGVAEISGLNENEIATAVGGALTSGRRALEESIADVHIEIANRQAQWILPMLYGLTPVKSGLSAMETALNSILQELSQKR